jgi:hypothetical protein
VEAVVLLGIALSTYVPEMMAETSWIDREYLQQRIGIGKQN